MCFYVIILEYKLITIEQKVIIMKKLGLMGGFGQESTIAFYRGVTDRIKEKLGDFLEQVFCSRSITACILVAPRIKSCLHKIPHNCIFRFIGYAFLPQLSYSFGFD